MGGPTTNRYLRLWRQNPRPKEVPTTSSTRRVEYSIFLNCGTPRLKLVILYRRISICIREGMGEGWTRRRTLTCLTPLYVTEWDRRVSERRGYARVNEEDSHSFVNTNGFNTSPGSTYENTTEQEQQTEQGEKGSEYGGTLRYESISKRSPREKIPWVRFCGWVDCVKHPYTSTRLHLSLFSSPYFSLLSIFVVRP